MDKLKQLLEAGLSTKDVQYFNIGKPYSIADQVLDKGIIYIEPISTDIESLTTGITDGDDSSVKIVLAKSVKDEFVKNAQKESATAYLARVMDGKNASGQVLTNTIRYIVRTNMRQLGITQSGINITYDSQEIENAPAGTVTATLTVSQQDHQSYVLT